jgi:hypothetical protein
MKMTNDTEVAGLLQENIAAQNRTTHAVRAFVRFFFIQLAAATIALTMFYFGTYNDDRALVIAAFLVFLGGITWAIVAGWTELALSDRSAPARKEERELYEAREVAWQLKLNADRDTAADARKAQVEARKAAAKARKEAR